MLRRIVKKVRTLPFSLADLAKDRKYRQIAKYNIANKFQRIYLYHIQKTGGTSLNHMFLSLGGEDPSDVYRRLGGKDIRVRRTVSVN